MKFSLLSVTYAGLWYNGKAISLEQQIKKAKEFGFDGLSIEAKRPIASPIDLTSADRKRIKSIAADEGIELAAVESLSDFSSNIMELRENNLLMLRSTLDLAVDLGVKMVKIFAAWPGIIDENMPAQYAPYDRGNYFKPLYAADLRVWQRCVEGIREVANWADDRGITLVLQNHGPVLSPGYEDVLAMRNEVGNDNLKLCLDVPMFFDRQKTEYVRESVEKCSDLIRYTHYGAWNFSETEDGEIVLDPAPGHGGQINYETFFEALYQHGYDGYLTSEYCLPVLKDHKVTGVEAIDAATKRGLKYMKQLIKKISAKKTVQQKAAVI
ncbi:MAG: sugar phosphate isomerase/epimerase family protein [Chitinophagaceae bacterium]